MNTEKVLIFNTDYNKLEIQLGKYYQPGQTCNIKINYHTNDQFSETLLKEMGSEKGIYFIDKPNKAPQIWTQGQPNLASSWFPTIDAPNERCTQEMLITVADTLTTISNGILIYSTNNGNGTKTDYWKMDVPHAPYLFNMVIGDFVPTTVPWKDIELTYWLEKGEQHKADKIFKNTPAMLSLFEERFGTPFPWPKYDQTVVREYIAGAMENTTSSIFHSMILNNLSEEKNRKLDFLVAHELAHQWFGNYVTCESWAHATLNEAMATYAEYLWFENVDLEFAEQHILEDRLICFEKSLDHPYPIVRFDYNLPSDQFTFNSYEKGATVMHMLRNYLGDSTFFNGIKTYLNQYALASVELNDFRKVFEEISGHDLHWFFDQWFYRSGYPKINIKHHYQNNTLQLFFEQFNDFDQPPYRIDTELKVWTDANHYKLIPIRFNQHLDTLSFTIDSQPITLQFDHKHTLLAEVFHEKSIQELKQLVNLGEHFLTRHQAISQYLELTSYDSLSSPETQILKLVLRDPNTYVQSLGLEAFDLYQIDPQPYEKEIESMAMNSKNNAIRATAISILADYMPEQHKPMFTELLKDSSDAVVGASLHGYIKSGAEDVNDKVESFKESASFDVMVAIAYHYISNNIKSQEHWFMQKIDLLHEELELYYMLSLMSKYLYANYDTAPPEQAIKFIRQYAIEHTNHKVRFGAYMALHDIRDLEGIEGELKYIKENETHQELISAYKSL